MTGQGRMVTRRAVAVGALGGVAALVLRSGRGRSADPSGVPPASELSPGAGRRSRPPGATTSASTEAGPARSDPVPSPSPPPLPELPRGGRALFPTYRLVGYCGYPRAAALGRLGIGDLDARAAEIEHLAARYAAGRVGQPVFELITVVAQRYPGHDGLYRVRTDPGVIATYLAAARRHRALLLLNIQPGRAKFSDEVRALRRWLREPDVGVALDPEWAVHAGQVPGRVFGHTTGAELDQVAGYLAGLVQEASLPEKAMVVHQLAPSVVTGLAAVRAHRGVAVIKGVDGIGTPAQKVSTWRKLVHDLPPRVHPGFKLFFDEDSRGRSTVMTAAEVLRLKPTPEYVLYE